jgi:hypothetical protein
MDIRTIRCVEQLRLVSSLPGDVVEMGVWEGPTTIALAQYIKWNSLDKKVYACDTFGGLPYDGKPGLDDMLKKGECTASFEKFWSNVVAAGVEDFVIPVPGLVENTLYSQLAEKQWCLAFLDMDLYEPTSFAARYVQPRISLGGVLGFHDYKFIRCPGIEIVVDKEINKDRFKMYGDHAGNCAWLQRVI